MIAGPRWKLRTLFVVTTVVALYAGIIGSVKLGINDSLKLAALPILVLTVIFERRMAQWKSLVIAGICVIILFELLLIPEIF